jgi:hypothetical protein
LTHIRPKPTSIVRLFTVVGVMAMVAAHRAIGQETPQPELPAQLPAWQATIVDYRWTFLAPEWVVETRKLDATVYAPTLHRRHVDFGSIEWNFEHRKAGRVPEFSCKYSDLMLPNECRTRWRDVYVDVPVPVVRNDYIEIDVPLWSWGVWRATVDVPRLVWKEQTLVVSLPALAVVPSAP